MGQWIFDQEILQLTGEIIERERGEREGDREGIEVPILCNYTHHIKYSVHPHQNYTLHKPPSCSPAPTFHTWTILKSNTHTIRSI